MANGLAVAGAALAKRMRDPVEVAEAITALLAMPASTRPLRTVVPATSPVAELNGETAPVVRKALEAYGFGQLLAPAAP